MKPAVVRVFPHVPGVTVVTRANGGRCQFAIGPILLASDLLPYIVATAAASWSKVGWGKDIPVVCSPDQDPTYP